jgi:hypothetical protein
MRQKIADKLFFAIVHGVMSQKKSYKILGTSKKLWTLFVLNVTRGRATEYGLLYEISALLVL